MAELFPDNVQLRTQVELWDAHWRHNRRLEAQTWRRFAQAAGCPEALTDEDIRWLDEAV